MFQPRGHMMSPLWLKTPNCRSTQNSELHAKALPLVIAVNRYTPKESTVTDQRDRPIHNKYIHTYIHTYLHTYLPTYLHTYIPTYLHTYIPTCSSSGLLHLYLSIQQSEDQRLYMTLKFTCCGASGNRFHLSMTLATK